MSCSKRTFHYIFAATVILLAVYLGAKTFPEEGWPGWGEPSAQTMLTLEHWGRDGMLHHKLLYLPIGYSKTVQYLDDPALRHHARGTVTGYLIGRRLYYTHYPSGFVIPYALLKKAGVDERHWFRITALAFSFGALILMYLFLNLISTPFVAYFGTLYYGASTMFIDFADALNNQPLDDLFRFAILTTSVLALQGSDAGRKRSLTVAIWALYLLLSLSSYDSTFFVYIWLVGLDLVVWYQCRAHGGTRSVSSLPWKKWVFFATPPVIGFFLQMLQNWWYMGWDDLVMDLKGVLLYRMGSEGPGVEGGGLFMHLKAVLTPVYLMTAIKTVSVPVLLFLAALYAFCKRKDGGRQPGFVFFVLLFIAGSCYTFLFAKSDDLNYQGRQLAPALGLLTASALAVVVDFLGSGSKCVQSHSRSNAPVFAIMVVAVACLTFLWFAQIKRTVGYMREWPNHAVNLMVLNDYKTIGSLAQGDGVVFYIDSQANKRYPQPPPTFEYYANKPVFYFRDTQDALRDFVWLRKRSEFPFTAIVCSPQKEAAGLFLPFATQPARVLNGYYYSVVIGPN